MSDPKNGQAVVSPWITAQSELEQVVLETRRLPLPERLVSFMQALQRVYADAPKRQELPTWQIKTYFRDVTTAKARSVLKQLEAEGVVCRSDASTPTCTVWVLTETGVSDTAAPYGGQAARSLIFVEDCQAQ